MTARSNPKLCAGYTMFLYLHIHRHVYCRKILCGTITSQSLVAQIVKNFVGYILLPMAELALCLLFIESLNHAPISCKVRLNL